jgi:predicted HicB family RNase H-like nuclease
VYEQTQINLRVSEEMKQVIDKRAADVGISRNQWLVRAVQSVLDQPVSTLRVVEEKV